MSFNYNEGGKEYQFAATMRSPLGDGLLKPEAVRMLQIAEKLAQDAAYGKEVRGAPLSFLLSAFERLEGMFLILERLIVEI